MSKHMGFIGPGGIVNRLHLEALATACDRAARGARLEAVHAEHVCTGSDDRHPEGCAADLAGRPVPQTVFDHCERMLWGSNASQSKGNGRRKGHGGKGEEGGARKTSVVADQ